ncbi:MAG: hypothetical protein ACRDDZ_12985 [Marinifilaceae bacterium]
MKTNFDINKRDRKIPYTIPEGFFDKLEDDIWKEASNHATVIKKKDYRYKTIILRSVASIAAIISLVFLLNINFGKNNQFTDIDIAFNKLSPQDQAFFIEVYEDDILLNN